MNFAEGSSRCCDQFPWELLNQKCVYKLHYIMSALGVTFYSIHKAFAQNWISCSWLIILCASSSDENFVRLIEYCLFILVEIWRIVSWQSRKTYLPRVPFPLVFQSNPFIFWNWILVKAVRQMISEFTCSRPRSLNYSCIKRTVNRFPWRKLFSTKS